MQPLSILMETGTDVEARSDQEAEKNLGMSREPQTLVVPPQADAGRKTTRCSRVGVWNQPLHIHAADSLAASQENLQPLRIVSFSWPMFSFRAFSSVRSPL